jgi:fatty-acyl-CoA synthase
LAAHDTSALRYIASSGSALGSSLTIDAIERFGPVLYNTYGSTEVSLATIAGPDELARQPSTAGRVVVGSVVRIVDDEGRDVPPGETGRIFVGNDAGFDGYTDGANKERLGGLVSTGDVGHMSDGLLFVDGRDDDMIVSGGENVFPGEVEECIASMVGVVEAAVVGIDDDDYGQRLAAFVVRESTARARKVTKQAVREHVRSHLARYKVPRDVTFVAELPRTTTGKVRRRDLGA